MRKYKKRGTPIGRPKRRPSTSATPIDDYRMGDLPLSEAATRYVELCNGIEVQDVSEAFAADDHERNAISTGLRLAVKSGRLRAEMDGSLKLLFPVKFARRVA